MYNGKIILRKTKKKMTDCVPDSATLVQASNGRFMIKCKCAECGITKTKFVKQQGNGSARPKGRAY